MQKDGSMTDCRGIHSNSGAADARLSFQVRQQALAGMLCSIASRPLLSDAFSAIVFAV
jgi:hypothetical protein